MMSVNSSLHLLFNHCFGSTAVVFIFTAFIVAKILLLLPLSILVFYLGHRRWRWQRSAKTTSHSDFFAYHSAAMELTCLVFFVIYVCGIYADLTVMAEVGFNLGNVAFPAEMFFHILTCVERYLAVVYPITYLGLKHSGWVRNISVVCVWLLSLGWMSVMLLYVPNFPIIPFLCLLVISLIVVSHCSVSVLRVLIRPGPGEGGRDEQRVNQSKRRAFHTVTAILGVLLLWFVGLSVCVALYSSDLLSHSDRCVVMISGVWFTLPSSLVLPLLFLHRAGKLLCCCKE